ncbi:MAG: polynucleotide kinase-phosphatase, partial [Gemmatimonadales bacterium]
VQGWARRRLLSGAARHGRPTVALVLALPLEISLARTAARGDRRVPPSAVRRQDWFLRTSLARLGEEGYDAVVVLNTPDQVERLEVRRIPGITNVPKERHPTL